MVVCKHCGSKNTIQLSRAYTDTEDAHQCLDCQGLTWVERGEIPYRIFHSY